MAELPDLGLLVVIAVATIALLGVFVAHRLTPYLDPATKSPPDTVRLKLEPGTHVLFERSPVSAPS